MMARGRKLWKSNAWFRQRLGEWIAWSEEKVRLRHDYGQLCEENTHFPRTRPVSHGETAMTLRGTIGRYQTQRRYALSECSDGGAENRV